MKISIIVTNWNGLSLLKKYLPDVIKNSPEAQEIIVSDDASADGSVDYLKELKKDCSRLKIIAHKENIGFGANTNHAVKAAKGDLVILLNSDIKPFPGYIKNTLHHFSDPNVLGVGFSEKGHENWGDIYWKNGYLQHRPGVSTGQAHSTGWLSGGSCILNRDLFLKLGGFDPVYKPFYFEDLDFGLRATKSGLKLIWEPKAIVEHRHEQTMSKIPRNFLTYVKERNHLLVTWRHLPDSMRFQNKLAILNRIMFGPNYLKIVLAARRQMKEYPHIVLTKPYTNSQHQ